MNKFTPAVVLLCLVSATVFAQGIQFETGDWKSVVDKAKKEKKMIYMDVYATWCGPCKVLAAQVFPQKQAGDKYNPNFVNYRLDAEKGEGIELAKKYAVTSYPTHLFIDPATQQLVYRSSGGGPDVHAFNHHADVALQEKADPMSLDAYAAKFKSGERSEPFLRAYLQKSQRLQVRNEEVLDVYVDVVSPYPPTQATVAFLATQTTTLFSKSVPYILANAGLFPNQPDRAGLNEFFARWSQGSLERAVRERNPALLDTLSLRLKQFTGNEDRATDFWYRTQYYSATGDQKGAFLASVEQADYLSAKPLSYFLAEDEKGAAQSRKMLRAELLANHVDSAKLDELVEQNMKQQPAAAKSSSYYTGTNLNGISQFVLQKQRGDTVLIRKALGWSKRAMELGEGMPAWAVHATTHAQLLYANGKRPEGIKLAEKAVAKADPATASTLLKTLEAMKAGSF